MNVARAAKLLDLQYVVVTSVTRDDLTDGGAGVFALTIRSIRELLPKAKIEVLIPDFNGSANALSKVIESRPNVVSHNVETVPGLYKNIRSSADYKRSLSLLKKSKSMSEKILTKSGFMLGLGETSDEVCKLMADIKNTGCDFLTIGQYLQPSPVHHEVIRYVHPAEFEEYNNIAKKMGFMSVASGPLVRSSYHAAELYAARSSINK
jgi:lipoic acid synthetase